MAYAYALIKATFSGVYWWFIGFLLYGAVGGDIIPSNNPPSWLELYWPAIAIIGGGIVVYALLILADRRWLR